MRLGLQDTDWDYVGARLAHEDDEEQAKFFKAFVKECYGWGTEFQVESQLAAINLKLTHAERETLQMIGYDDNQEIHPIEKQG